MGQFQRFQNSFRENEVDDHSKDENQL